MNFVCTFTDGRCYFYSLCTHTKILIHTSFLKKLFEGIWLTLLGSVASILVSSSFIPQIIKGYKTKRLDDVSYLLMILISVGMSLWIVYGIEKQDFVIIGANVSTVILNMILLGLKARYAKRKIN
jgi:MtN3 and saliva related transmembrane protein